MKKHNHYYFIQIVTLSYIMLFLSCNTLEKNSSSDYSIIDKTKIQDKEDLNRSELKIVYQNLSRSVLEYTDPYYADFASLVLQLISEKNWEEVSIMTPVDMYNSYVVDSPGTLIDYCMFMLHTGDKGISTNYSLNEIDDAYYTSSVKHDEGLILEGIYLYPTGETEYFKILIQNNGDGLIITRE